MHTEFSFAVRGRVQQNYIQTLTILKKTGIWWSGSHPVYGVDHPVAGAHVRLDNLGLDTASVNLVIKILVYTVNMVNMVNKVYMVNSAWTPPPSTWSARS